MKSFVDSATLCLTRSDSVRLIWLNWIELIEITDKYTNSNGKHSPCIFKQFNFSYFYLRRAIWAKLYRSVARDRIQFVAKI